MRYKRLLLAFTAAVSFTFTTPTSAKADPVSIIATAFVAALGEGAAIAVATFIVNTAVTAAASFGLNKVSAALSGKNKQGIQERQASVTSLSVGEVPREMVAGVCVTGGSMVDAFNHGGQYGTDYVSMCIALADHAVESLYEIIVDDAGQLFTGNGVQPGFSGLLQVHFANATEAGTTPPAHVIAAGTGWTETDRLAGISHVWVTYKFDEKVWPQGHPKLKFQMRGIRVYDPRRDPALGYVGPNPNTWEDRSTHAYDANAALVRYAFTRGIYAEGHQGDPNYLLIGRGLSAEEAPPERVIAAANLCAEPVTDPDGQANIRYKVGGVIRASDDFIQVEEMFAAAMAGVIVQREGGVEVEPGHAKAAVATITDGDLIVGETVSFQAFLPDADGGRINTVVPRYVSPAQNWTDHAGPVRRDLADIAEDGGPRETTLPLVLVYEAGQADRCAEIARRLARLERRATIVLGPEYSWLEEGDWIAWDSDRHHGGSTVRYRIESWSLDEQWRMRLSLREIASSVYGVPDPIEDTAEPPPVPVPVDALTLPGASAQAITLAGETSVLPAIRFTWDTPVDGAMRAIRGEVRVLGETDVATVRTEDLTLGDGWVVTNGVTPEQTLQARLVPIGDPTRPVLPSVWFTITTGQLIAQPSGDLGDTTPPAVPSGLSLSSVVIVDPVTQAPTVKIIATWTANTETDLAGYITEIMEAGGSVVSDVAPSNRDEWIGRTGVLYQVRIAAYDGINNVSGWTSWQTVYGAGDATAPAAPTGLTVQASLSSFYLSVTGPSDADLAQIEWFENTTNNSGTAVSLGRTNCQPGGVSTLTRSGLAAGQARYFWAKAIDTSRNASGFSAEASATIPTVQVTDFASSIRPVELFSSDAAAGSPSLGRTYFNTTDFKIYRGTGAAWTRSTDGLDITADSITAGQIAAGAISATEISAGAITTDKLGALQVVAEKIAAGAITVDKIQAGSITGDRISAATGLPGTITVDGTGINLFTSTTYANDPLVRANELGTQIDPGRVLISGGTSLANWRLGSNLTLINGGAVGANTIDANKLTIGNRGVVFDRFNWSTSGDTVSWQNGRVQYIDDSGVAIQFDISGGSLYWPAGSDIRYLYWVKGETILRNTSSASVANGVNTIVVGTYYGGAQFTAMYGRTIINGDYIATGAIQAVHIQSYSIDATKLNVTSLAAITANLGTVTAGVVQNAAGTTFFDLTNGRSQYRRGSYDLRMGSIGSGVVLWYGPASIGIGSESRTNGAWAFGDDGKVYYGSAELTVGGGAAVKAWTGDFSTLIGYGRGENAGAYSESVAAKAGGKYVMTVTGESASDMNASNPLAIGTYRLYANINGSFSLLDTSSCSARVADYTANSTFVVTYVVPYDMTLSAGLNAQGGGGAGSSTGSAQGTLQCIYYPP